MQYTAVKFLWLGACLALAPHAAAVLDARGINISTDATTPMAGLRKWDEVPQGLEGEGRGDADPIWIHIVGDISIVRTVAAGDPELNKFLETPGQVMTGFLVTNDAIRSMLRKVGRFGGVALANKTFSNALSDYSNVLGKYLTLEDLRKAAPTQLKTAKGELLNITLEPTFQGGVAVNGFPIKVANQSTSDRKSMLHIVDGLLVPPSQQAILDFWIQAAAAANGSASASAGANASNAAGSGAGALPGVPARSGAGAGHGALPALVALAVGALALLT